MNPFWPNSNFICIYTCNSKSQTFITICKYVNKSGKNKTVYGRTYGRTTVNNYINSYGL